MIVTVVYLAVGLPSPEAVIAIFCRPRGVLGWTVIVNPSSTSAATATSEVGFVWVTPPILMVSMVLVYIFPQLVFGLPELFYGR